MRNQLCIIVLLVIALFLGCISAAQSPARRAADTTSKERLDRVIPNIPETHWLYELAGELHKCGAWKGSEVLRNTPLTRRRMLSDMAAAIKRLPTLMKEHVAKVEQHKALGFWVREDQWPALYRCIREYRRDFEHLHIGPRALRRVVSECQAADRRAKHTMINRVTTTLPR